MRLLRLRVAHFRGIDAREVTFEDGVTIVEGPNEVGKSSLAEALLLLIDPSKNSNSRHRDVERVRPIGRDEIPEVEAEFEAEPYRFTYQKRFSHKKGGGVELQVSSPKAEQLAGDAAMQRFDEILHESLDVDLFRALCVEQGRAIGQTPLGGKAWLTRALDDAADGPRSDDESRQETLFDAARGRYLEYYTEKTGTPTRELSAAAKALADAESRHDELAGRLRDLEDMIDEHAGLTAELRDVDSELPKFEQEATDTRAAVDALLEIERRADARMQSAESQGVQVERLQGDVQRRRDLAGDIQTLERQLEPRSARVAELAAQVENARADRDGADRALRDATRRREAAEAERVHARADVERFALLERAAPLRTRREKAADLRERVEVLTARVRGGVDADTLERVDGLERDALRARDALRNAGARLSIEALRDLDLRVDEHERKLARGETFDCEPGTPVDVTVPDVLRIRLHVGASTADLGEAAETAEAALRDALRELGVPDVAAARRRHLEAQTAGHELDIARSQLDELAEGLEIPDGSSVLDAIDVELRALSTAIERLGEARPAHRAEPRDAEHADEVLAQAETAESAARAREAEARETREGVIARVAELEKEHAVLSAEVDSLSSQLADKRTRLEASRNTQSDADLEKALADARRRHADLRAEADALSTELAAANLEQKRLFAQNAAEALAGLQKRRRDAELRLKVIDGVLRHDESEGLGEQLQVAEADLEARREHHAQIERRARAARLLFETMRDRRAAAKAARVRPLTDRIEKLGRIAFDDSFGVTLDDELAIADRTLGGLTVPFDNLSVGAREQLDLLTRIAVAQAVATHGGVPLILDDTLGHADPDRLAKMNALLALAGRTVQVIVLTCHPERFARVGGARLVRL